MAGRWSHSPARLANLDNKLIVFTPAGHHSPWHVIPAERRCIYNVDILDMNAANLILIRLPVPTQLNMGRGPTLPMRYWRVDSCGRLYAVYTQSQDTSFATVMEAVQAVPDGPLPGHTARLVFDGLVPKISNDNNAPVLRPTRTTSSF